MTASLEILDMGERTSLEECEATIQANLAGFIQTGEALATIRDGRLYRETHPSFEAYCSERWSLSRNYAHRLIQASGVITNLLPIGNTGEVTLPMPMNEAQARPLAKLMPELQREAWAKAVESAPDGKVTAKHVETIVKAIAPPDPDLSSGGATVLNSTLEAKRKRSASNGPQELLTPPQYIDAVREVLGEIDLDPASSDLANLTIQAKTFYSPMDNGLRKSWTGRVFLSPPLGKDEGDGVHGRWPSRLLDSYLKGEVTEAILLVGAETHSEWFKPLWDYPVCFTDHSIHYIAPEYGDWIPPYGHAFVYLGPNVETFASVFRRFGAVVQQIA